MPVVNIPENERLRLLDLPSGKVRVVLDTDTYNEIDDQFALVHALLSPERLTVEAVYAAPFHNKRSTGPEDGMERSYDEILRMLELLNVPAENFAYRGSKSYLPKANQPVDSEAARDLVEKALHSSEPLYVATIGAPTNVASAILMEPSIIERIVVVWLGGMALYWPSASEFNLRQDLHASRVLLDSGVPLVLVPCKPVTSHLVTNIPEIERCVEGQGPLGNYLAKIFKVYGTDEPGWSKVIWDVAVTSWLINPDWAPTTLVHSPLLTDHLTWSFDSSRHFIRIANFVQRDPIFNDLFAKIAHHSMK